MIEFNSLERTPLLATDWLSCTAKAGAQPRRLAPSTPVTSRGFVSATRYRVPRSRVSERSQAQPHQV